MPGPSLPASDLERSCAVRLLGMFLLAASAGCARTVDAPRAQALVRPGAAISLDGRLSQYDTVSENVGRNTWLRRTIKPGNDRFVAWNPGLAAHRHPSPGEHHSPERPGRGRPRLDVSSLKGRGETS